MKLGICGSSGNGAPGPRAAGSRGHHQRWGCPRPLLPAPRQRCCGSAPAAHSRQSGTLDHCHSETCAGHQSKIDGGQDICMCVRQYPCRPCSTPTAWAHGAPRPAGSTTRSAWQAACGHAPLRDWPPGLWRPDNTGVQHAPFVPAGTRGRCRRCPGHSCSRRLHSGLRRAPGLRPGRQRRRARRCSCLCVSERRHSIGTSAAAKAALAGKEDQSASTDGVKA